MVFPAFFILSTYIRVGKRSLFFSEQVKVRNLQEVNSVATVRLKTCRHGIRSFSNFARISQLKKVCKRRYGLPCLNLTKDLKRLMWKGTNGMPTKILRYKVLINHVEQKRLCCVYYQYVEEIISPSNNVNHLETKKRFWGLLKHAKADSTGVNPLKSNRTLIAEPNEKTSLLNSYFQAVFTGETPPTLK